MLVKRAGFNKVDTWVRPFRPADQAYPTSPGATVRTRPIRRGSRGETDTGRARADVEVVEIDPLVCPVARRVR